MRRAGSGCRLGSRSRRFLRACLRLGRVRSPSRMLRVRGVCRGVSARRQRGRSLMVGGRGLFGRIEMCVFHSRLRTRATTEIVRLILSGALFTEMHGFCCIDSTEVARCKYRHDCATCDGLTPACIATRDLNAEDREQSKPHPSKSKAKDDKQPAYDRMGGKQIISDSISGSPPLISPASHRHSGWLLFYITSLHQQHFLLFHGRTCVACTPTRMAYAHSASEIPSSLARRNGTVFHGMGGILRAFVDLAWSF